MTGNCRMRGHSCGQARSRGTDTHAHMYSREGGGGVVRRGINRLYVPLRWVVAMAQVHVVGLSDHHGCVHAGVLANAAAGPNTHVDGGRSGTHGSLGTGYPDIDAAVSGAGATGDVPRPVGYSDMGQHMCTGDQSGGLARCIADRAGAANI